MYIYVWLGLLDFWWSGPHNGPPHSWSSGDNCVAVLFFIAQHNQLSSKFQRFRKRESCQLGVLSAVEKYIAQDFLIENEAFSNKTKVFKDGSTKVERTVNVYANYRNQQERTFWPKEFLWVSPVFQENLHCVQNWSQNEFGGILKSLYDRKSDPDAKVIPTMWRTGPPIICCARLTVLLCYTPSW